jgi:hypothetical protein
MPNLLGRLFARFFIRRPRPVDAPAASATTENATTAFELDAHVHADAHFVPYDENLLERARTQWQFGDWTSLAQLNRDTLQHHPDRAKLALLAAAGHQQVGDMVQARQFARLAQDWGVSKKLVSQILIAGTYNTLGRAAAILGNEQRALGHFDAAIATGSPYADPLIKQARLAYQLNQLGMDAPQRRLYNGT